MNVGHTLHPLPNSVPPPYISDSALTLRLSRSLVTRQSHLALTIVCCVSTPMRCGVAYLVASI